MNDIIKSPKTAINGLDLAEKFFIHEAIPRFQQAAPDLFQNMASGLVGDGSDCFGYDDEISMDHDWGPGFCIWLTSTDHVKWGKEAKALYDTLPHIFDGYGPRQVSAGNENRIGVRTIDDFYAKELFECFRNRN